METSDTSILRTEWRWACLRCQALAGDPRPVYCLRCGARGTYIRLVDSPVDVPRNAPKIIPAYKLIGQARRAPLGKPWDDEVFGIVSRPIRMLVSGPPGSGKTWLGLALGERMAEKWGPTVFLALDEGGESPTFRAKVARLELTKLQVAVGFSLASLTPLLDSENWATVVVDGASRLNATSSELNSWVRAYNVSWVLISEATKDGSVYRGDSLWGHWADVAVSVKWDEIKVWKNRFGKTGVQSWGPCKLLSQPDSALPVGMSRDSD